MAIFSMLCATSVSGLKRNGEGFFSLVMANFTTCVGMHFRSPSNLSLFTAEIQNRTILYCRAA